MTEQDRERAKERQQQYNYNYYSLNRDRLLHKAYRKRAMDFMEKHGEEAFVTGYKHRTRKEKPREPQFEAVEEDLDNLDNDDVLPYSSDDDFQ
ncbi:hypothetical protein PQX77_000593 [Marasmius sp. AFHP31]|nr:hypothetical protein PQX77_000593 [Marasmius sp. AFHP31]